MPMSAQAPCAVTRLCWSCGELFALASPVSGGADISRCSARCAHCGAVSRSLVPPPPAAPWPGAYERPAPASLTLRRVHKIAKRRRVGGPGSAMRYLVQWDEHDALLPVGGRSDSPLPGGLSGVACGSAVSGAAVPSPPVQPAGGKGPLALESWEVAVHLSLDPSLVAFYDDMLAAELESAQLARQSAPPRVSLVDAVRLQMAWCESGTLADGGSAGSAAPERREPVRRGNDVVWNAGDMVEVQWKGKGFRGSWALAEVARVHNRDLLLVRFVDFVDDRGNPLEEDVPSRRVRLVPPKHSADWRPQLGEHLESRSNDLWWEGRVERFDTIKGYLFAYEYHPVWIWLPIDGLRPRPSFSVSFPRNRVRAAGDEAEPEAEAELEGEADESASDEGAPPVRKQSCPHAGCILTERHKGLCQFGDDTVAGRDEAARSMRQKGLTERARKLEVLEQEEILRSIHRRRASRRAQEAAQPTKVIPGSRMAQWHPQLFVTEFEHALTPVLVFDTSRTPAGCCGQLILTSAQIAADVLRMIRTELNVQLDGRRVVCVPHASGPEMELLELTGIPRTTPNVEWLPQEGRVDLLVIDS